MGVLEILGLIMVIIGGVILGGSQALTWFVRCEQDEKIMKAEKEWKERE